MAWKIKVGRRHHVKERVIINGKTKIKSFGTFASAELANNKIRLLEEEQAKNNYNLIDYDARLWEICHKFIEDPVRRGDGTLYLYGNTVRLLKIFFPKNPRLRDINGDLVKEFIIWLKAPQEDRMGHAHATIHQHLRNFRAIMNFAKKYIEKNPVTEPLKQFGTPSGTKIYLSFDEQDRLFNAALQIKIRNPKRNLELWQMIKTLYATGLRKAELLNMAKEHMVGDYEIEIPSRTSQRLRQAERNPTKSADPFILDLNDEIAPFFWAVESGRIWKGWTRNSFRDQFNRAAEMAGLRIDGLSKVTPHTLRHTFAKDTLRTGKTSLPELQVMLNHQDIQSTMVYNRWAKKERFRENMNALIRPNVKKVI